MVKEITLDMSRVNLPGWSGKQKRSRSSSPREAVYQKRYKWWIAHDFGEDAARWAAKYRFGKPKRVRNVKPGEVDAINNIIRLADRRIGEVRYRMRTFGETKEQAIKHLDDELRTRDKREKVLGRFVEPDISIYHKKIQPNIFKVLS